MFSADVWFVGDAYEVGDGHLRYDQQYIPLPPRPTSLARLPHGDVNVLSFFCPCCRLMFSLLLFSCGYISPTVLSVRPVILREIFARSQSPS